EGADGKTREAGRRGNPRRGPVRGLIDPRAIRPDVDRRRRRRIDRDRQDGPDSIRPDGNPGSGPRPRVERGSVHQNTEQDPDEAEKAGSNHRVTLSPISLPRPFATGTRPGTKQPA